MPDYGYSKVTDEQKFSLEQLALKFQELEDFIERHSNPGWRRALAITSLEEAAMWASKSIAKSEPVKK